MLNNLCLLFSLLFINSCANPQSSPSLLSPQQLVKMVYVVNHGKHTGIAIKRSDIPETIWPEVGDFLHANYLEVGWGAADYYQARQPSLSQGLQALLFPSASVLHVVVLPNSPKVSFPPGQVAEVRLSEDGFIHLCEYIHLSYLHDIQGRALPVGNSVYGQGFFYQAQGQYHLLNNCNHWTASALEVAGYPLVKGYVMSADYLMNQIGGRDTQPVKNE